MNEDEGEGGGEGIKYLLDKVRRIEEAFGTPEWIVEISSVGFKFSRKSSIDDSNPTTIFDEIHHQRRRPIFSTTLDFHFGGGSSEQ